MSKSAPEYVNKKNQAPSFTDRILFRNNSCLDFKVNKYTAMHDIYGSDHRPVILDMTLKDFGHPAYSCIDRILEEDEPEQGKGVITLQIVNIH